MNKVRGVYSVVGQTEGNKCLSTTFLALLMPTKTKSKVFFYYFNQESFPWDEHTK